MHSDGFTIVILSNQLGVTKKKTTHDDVKTRFENAIFNIGVPISVLYAYGNDGFRKPHTKMFNLLKTEFHLCDEGIEISPESFYCGDAAGRPKTKTQKKDFSNSDLLFAYNCGLTF